MMEMFIQLCWSHTWVHMLNISWLIYHLKLLLMIHLICLTFSAPKDEMKKLSTSSNSQEDLLLEMSSDELDIPVCTPNMTSSHKCLKVCFCFWCLTSFVNNYCSLLDISNVLLYFSTLQIINLCLFVF